MRPSTIPTSRALHEYLDDVTEIAETPDGVVAEYRVGENGKVAFLKAVPGSPASESFGDGACAVCLLVDVPGDESWERLSEVVVFDLATVAGFLYDAVRAECRDGALAEGPSTA